jgi:hypothetical protein
VLFFYAAAPAAVAAAALVQAFGPVLTGQIVRALGPDLTGGRFVTNIKLCRDASSSVRGLLCNMHSCLQHVIMTLTSGCNGLAGSSMHKWRDLVLT